jgi:predicted nuclease of predicted toxin-antitoxin system
MKIKLDENLPTRLVAFLQSRGHDVDTVPQEGLKGAADLQLWEAVQASGRFLITQDLDFSDVRRFAPGTHHGLLLIRLRAPGREALMRRIASLFEDEAVATWEKCFVVATDTKLRVRRPPI